MTVNPAVDSNSCGISRTLEHDVVLVHADDDCPDLFDTSSFVSPDGSNGLSGDRVRIRAAWQLLEFVACGASPPPCPPAARAGTTYLIMTGGIGADDVPGAPPELTDRGGTFDLTIMTTHGQLLDRSIPRHRHLRR
jgi:hypothetical protein